MKKRLFSIIFLISIFLMFTTIIALADINWRQFEGVEIRLLMNKHPFTTFIEPKLPEFEEKTGIKRKTNSAINVLLS